MPAAEVLCKIYKQFYCAKHSLIMKEELKETSATHTERDLSRRRFLGYASIAGAGLLVASCSKDDDDDPAVANTGDVDLGSGDTGLLNYIYSLAQLHAAFYTKMCTPMLITQITAEELKSFPEIRDHKIAHRELLRNILKGKAIPDQAH
jgi:hypothetical protein